MAVAERLTEVAGARVTLTASRLRPDLVSFSADRTFWEAEVEDGEGTRRALLVKGTPVGRGGSAPAHLAELNGRLVRRGLPVPALHGSVEAGGWRASVWDLRHGRSEPGFERYAPEEVDRLADAVARLAAAADAADGLGLPRGMAWAEPVADRIRPMLETEACLTGLAAQVERLAAVEDQLIAALDAVGPGVLTHNDLKASNVVLGDDGEAWIVDWDSASVGPPGASLRRFATHGGELEQRVAARFAESLGRLGSPVPAADVLFVMRGQELFWNLVTGVRRGHLRRILAGLWQLDAVADDLERRADAAAGGYPRPAPESLKTAVRAFMEKNRGRLYSPIPHPDFAGWPSSRGTERFDVIEPHLDHRGGTALDVGTHFGTFAHWLEDLGYRVTAVEKSGRYAAIARQVRDLTGKRFELVTGSVFDLERSEYDVVFALNIFHHFLKTEEAFRGLERFLDRLRCKTMIFQAHVSAEPQMATAFRNMEQDEFAAFVAERAGLTEIAAIGSEGPRTIYKLSGPKERPAPRVGLQDVYLHAEQPYRRQREVGFLARKGMEPWPLALPLDWAADPFGDPNWRSKLEHWRMTDPILAEHFRTGDPALLREAFDFALDWHRFHLAEGHEPSFTWADGATGIRALRVALFADRVRSGELQVTDPERDALDELVEEHARRLQDAGFIATTNHGLFQVFGLRLLAEAADDRPWSADAAAFAASKFKEILGKQFDRHGVHREHSPAYHFFVRRLIATLGGAHRFADPGIQEVLERAARVEPWLAHPDGREPRIGDSDGTKRELLPPPGPVVTQGDGRRHLLGDLTESGYAIVRSAPPERESMLFMSGAAHSGTHKHADDLGFELFERGRPVLVDTGKYGYFKDAMRHYVKSGAAHNTISLESERVGPLAVAMTGSSLRSATATLDGDFRLTGCVERPGLFRQRRTLLYDPGRYLVVRDDVAADAERAFASSLLLAPDLVPEVSATGFAVQVDASTRMTAALLLPEAARVEATRGQEDPLLGWYAGAYGKAEPATVVRAICPGREVTIVWALWFGEAWRAAALAAARRAS